jgi:hypothetical protein
MAASWTLHGMASFLLKLNNGRTIVAEIGDFDVDSDSIWRFAVIHVLPFFTIAMGSHRFEKIALLEFQ